MRSLLGGAAAPFYRGTDTPPFLWPASSGKGFGEGTVLDGVSLTVSAGQRMAVIGDNGVGKSTLLRLLAGTLTPDAGSVMCTTTRTLIEHYRSANDAGACSLVSSPTVHRYCS